MSISRSFLLSRQNDNHYHRRKKQAKESKKLLTSHGAWLCGRHERKWVSPFAISIHLVKILKRK